MAYQKESLQSSTYENHSAELANDGDLYTYSYVQSLYEVNPWWAVDLGSATVVHQINFTNTAEPHGTRVYCVYIIYVCRLVLSKKSPETDPAISLMVL